MTPGARVQATIEILDRIAAGQAAEQALTSWARASRFAGSKDRAAVRDHVFDALRRWRSSAVRGGAESGRGRMIGVLREQGVDISEIFSGFGHAPAALSADEAGAGSVPDGLDAHDLPEWAWMALLEGRSPEQAAQEAALLRDRAPVDLRVNLLKSDREAAQKALASEGIVTEPVPLATTALRVTEGARGVARSQAFLDGLVELQDAASQAVVEALPLEPGMRVLDYCAGGGGKALAIAALTGVEVVAHDISAARMKTIPERAARSGAQIVTTTDPKGAFDLVFCDVPCSGSGSWRRAPAAKWQTEAHRLDALERLQRDVLSTARAFVGPGGGLSFATCSLFQRENEANRDWVVSNFPDFSIVSSASYDLASGGDGFFVSNFRKN